jgi:endo-1,4-beta-xylanase
VTESQITRSSTPSAPIAAAKGVGLVSALTFDDGPNGLATERLLDFLEDRGIRATFCVIGQNVAAPGGAELLRRMVRDGHVLCNHSTTHVDMGKWEWDEIEADLVNTLQIIRDAVGDEDVPVPYYRAPHGSWGQTGLVAAALGMRSLDVINVIDDWVTQDVPTLISKLRTAMRPGELVLAHDGGGDREGTVDAVIAVVTERLAEGWTFTLPSDD